MAAQLGIVAGSGEFPFLVLKEAQKFGYRCLVAGIRGETKPSLQDKVKNFEWFDAGEIQNLISFFKNSGIREVVLAGKVDHRIIYNKKELRKSSPLFLTKNKNRGPTALLETIIAYMSKEGIKVKNPMFFLSPFLCEEGILTKVKPSPELEEDIAFGWEIAKSIADLDIGQTVIVKSKAVVAVEGMEGTDKTIKRGGQLAGEGTVVVKVARSFQDFRIDLPAVGLKTVKILIKAGSKALCFEAHKMPFFQKERAICLANANNISIIAKKS